jgi:NTP pyrophosphatase (non-canonical NTP hydrolase)
MDLNTYIQGAIKTESKIGAVSTDVDYLSKVLCAVINAGNLLDVVKKDVFYGLPTDPNKLTVREERIRHNTLYLEEVTERIVQHEPQQPETLSSIDPRIAHAIIGMATEAVELLEALHEAIIFQQPIDKVNLLEELGDLNWYHAIAVDALEGDWELILETNLKKLEARNKGKKFNADATINRDVDAERTLLEGNLAGTS